MAKIANVALTDTFDTFRTRSNIGYDRLSQFAINNSSLYANTVTANTSFTSKGTTNLGDSTGDLTTIAGRTTIGTNLAVSGNTSISKNLTVSGNTTISGLIANSSLGSSDYALKTNGTSVFWGIALSNTFTTTVATRTLVPTSNITFNLGSTTKRYKDIFLANSTIHLGAAQISATGSKILFNNEAAVSNSFLTSTFVTKATERAALANTNLAITNVKTGLTGTNTAIRTLVSDRLQVANASTLYATKISPTTSALFAHTGRATISTNLAVSGNSALGSTTVSSTGLITAPSVGSVIPFYFSNQAAFPSASTYHGAIAHSHSDGKMYFAHGGQWEELSIISTVALANTNASISNVKTGLTSTNTALRLLISDRLQVANASTLYATKSNPTTSGLLAHTGRSTISTNLAVSGNTTISGLIANSSLGSANFLLKSSGTGTFWAAAAAGGGLLGMTAVTATGTFTIPAGVSKLKVTILGGGGGGGGGAAAIGKYGTTFYGAGGGGGGTAIQFISSVTPGNTITVTVGSGGAGGGSGSGGTTGGTSSIASGTESITSVSATGGAGGERFSSTSSSSGGLGGLGSGGVLSLRGGGGTRTEQGGDSRQLGQGGSSMFGGSPPQVGTSVGVPSSSLYGVGGSGFGSGANGSGAAGTAGLVLFEY